MKSDPYPEKRAHASSFRDLLVYQKIRRISQSVFVQTQTFPREEMYSLTDQLRRSVRSVGAQIAEAWAKRRYEKHFVAKLTDADAERMESEHWISEAVDCGYITADMGLSLTNALEEVGRMLNGMINKATSFCSPATTSYVKECVAEYICEPTTH